MLPQATMTIIGLSLYFRKTIKEMIPKTAMKVLKPVNSMNTVLMTMFTKVEAIKDIETAKATGEEILAEAKDFFAEKLLEALDDVKAKAKAKLDTMVNQALELIPDETLRQDINTFY